MRLFFDAGKYLTRVERPRKNTTKDRRDQINDYIVRYFEMYPHDYIQKAQFAARIYVNEILPDEAVNIEGLTTPEVQAISVITQVLQDFPKICWMTSIIRSRWLHRRHSSCTVP